MSLIKPFAGFTTPDGMVHPTRTAAENHIRDQKLMTELNAFAREKAPTFAEDMLLDHSVNEGAIASWLYNNREALTRIFSGTKNVSLRKPRADKGKPRVKKADKAVYIPGAGGGLGSVGTAAH